MKSFLLFAHDASIIGLPTIATERVGIFIQILCLLLLIAVGMYLFNHAKNRITKIKRGTKTQKKLEITETKYLGNRQFLCVVTYENQRILIGASPNNVQFLCALEHDKSLKTLNENL